jgi:ABC-type amino acid transport substrate-binding protein
LFFSACGKKEPPLVVLTTGTNPPFSFVDQHGNLSGFDIGLIQLISETIGRQIDLKTVPFDDLIKKVQAKEGDIAIAAISITEDRKRLVDFSAPYHEGGFALIMLETTSSDLKDLSDKSLGVGEGTWQEGAVKASLINIPNLLVRSVGPIKMDDIVAKIRSGEWAAYVLDADSAKHVVDRTQGLKLVPLDIGVLGMGIVTGKGSHHTQLVADAMVKRNDDIVALKGKWFSAASN